MAVFTTDKFSFWVVDRSQNSELRSKIWKDDKQKYIGGIYHGQGLRITAIPTIFTEVRLLDVGGCIEDM